MLHPVIVNIARRHGLSATSDTVFGRIGDVILALSLPVMSGGRQCHLVVNVNQLPASERVALQGKLKASKLPGFAQYQENKKLGTLTVIFTRKLFGTEEHFQTRVETYLDRVTAAVPGAPAGKVVLWGSAPLLESQVEDVLAEQRRNERSLGRRFSASLSLSIAVPAFAGIALHWVPFLKRFQDLPHNYWAISILVAHRFVKGRRYDRSRWRLELGLLLVVLLLSGLSCWLGFSIGGIPNEFRVSSETVDLSISRWFHQNWRSMSLALVLISAASGWVLYKGPRREPETLWDLSQYSEESWRAYMRGSGKITIAFLVGFLLPSLSLFALFWFHEWLDGDFVSFAPILAAGGVLALVFAAGFAVWARFDREVFEASTRINQERRSRGLFVLVAALFSVLPTVPLLLWIMILNDQLDFTPLQVRSAVVERGLATGICRRSIDVEDPRIEFGVCEPRHGPVRGGERVTFQYKPGLLRNGLVKDIQVERPLTWESLLRELGSPSKVRSFDVQAILKVESQKKRLLEEMQPNWLKQCNAGSGDDCRLASYLLGAKTQKDEQLALLRKGCSNGDYMSCYGILSLEKNDEDAKRLLARPAYEACSKADLNACDIYAIYWRDGRAGYARDDYAKVLSVQCEHGDAHACERKVWERNRI